LQAGPVQTPAAVAAAAAASLALPPQPHQQQPEQQQQLDAVYRQFLDNTLVKEFHRLSRSLPDIQSQAAALWPKYLSGAAKQQQQQHDKDDGVSVAQSWAAACVTAHLQGYRTAGPRYLHVAA
jgi:hypothetical protein